MDIPPVHICHSLASQNEIIKRKYQKLTRKYKEMHGRMLELQEKITRIEIEKEYNTLSTKTSVAKPAPKTMETKKDNSIDKLLVLHNKLLKQFEKETKQNSNQSKRLRKLECENEKLCNEIFNANQQVDFLKKQSQDKDSQLISLKMKSNSQSKQESHSKVALLTKGKKRLQTENKKLKEELNGLDKDFFDEIEDMKFALQQSAKLNTNYEKAIRKLCKRSGLNYQNAVSDKDKSFEHREKMRSFHG